MKRRRQKRAERVITSESDIPAGDGAMRKLEQFDTITAESLKGKLVRYEMSRWGMCQGSCRVPLPKDELVLTAKGRKVKKPTTHGIIVRGASFERDTGWNWKGEIVRLPVTAIECYRERRNGKDIPVDLEE